MGSMNFRKVILFGLVGFLSAFSARPESGPVEYVSIEVNRFEVQEGIELPSKVKITLVTDIKLKLARKLGIEVVSEGQDHRSTGPGLRLTGTITEFKGGNRALRYIVPVT